MMDDGWMLDGMLYSGDEYRMLTVNCTYRTYTFAVRDYG